MSFEFSLFERNRIVNAMFGGAAYTPATSFKVKAYSNTISLTGTGGTEITSAGYSEINVPNNTTIFPTTTTGAKASTAEYTRPLTADASIKSIGVFDQDGNFIGRKVYATPLAVLAGQDWRFPVGSITPSVQNPS